MQIILGIDPGSRITGFGLIKIDGPKLSYIESGCIRTGGGELPARLKVIFEEMVTVVENFSPDVVAIERVFMHRNPDSALKLGQARGAAICAAVTKGLQVSEYTPAEIKRATVGKGNANKQQVQHMVKALLSLPGTPQEDAADALAVAICHANTGEMMSQIGSAAGAIDLKGRRRGRYR
ncbi:MAG: crossover junction endodeoxyribonuclease RuvC [Gammaproteobacteria bacterium]|nr:crossover junction endodeoxyribonuclease RuvC [Gammaproteobacteria bacterium]MCW8982567.1 crossover junction endodeoxyribonuclease RuvC [Gammaproteobacteria bacterium]